MSVTTITALFRELQEIDPTSLISDHDQKHKALQLSRKLSVALDDPLNQAVDLVFKASFREEEASSTPNISALPKGQKPDL
jgi:hypothetical protein